MMDRVTQLKHHFTAIEHTIRMAEANAARENSQASCCFKDEACH